MEIIQPANGKMPRDNMSMTDGGGGYCTFVYIHKKCPHLSCLYYFY